MSLFTAHAGLMAAGFLLTLSALLIAATQRRKKWWLRAHRAAGVAGTTLILIGAAVAVSAVASLAGGHLRTAHSWVGLLTVSIAVLTPILGLLQFHFTARAGHLRILHRLSGRLLNLIAPTAILLGSRMAGLI